ncbi:ADAMTS-like protein 1 [Eufriesea mexicana]|uniref:ADAMTS-like protein 1 n=1 Tax=Eufriesea mexicana TaxID=516756 RepID=A0A310SHH7_9HYME|nr:ADAMTS-like protein 1 [Eufriesea mexicana]
MQRVKFSKISTEKASTRQPRETFRLSSAAHNYFLDSYQPRKKPTRPHPIPNPVAKLFNRESSLEGYTSEAGNSHTMHDISRTGSRPLVVGRDVACEVCFPMARLGPGDGGPAEGGRGRNYAKRRNLPCENPSDFRAEQCAAFDDVPYSGQLLKWYPHYDPTRPCALICRGEQSLENTEGRLRQETSAEKTLPRDATDALQLDSEETIVVQLADKVEDGTKCYIDSVDVCIGGECMKVGCDLRVGSNRNTDPCGVCGGNGSSCQSRYSWSLESISACSKSCGGGFKIARAVCKAIGPDDTVVDDSYCDPDNRPEKTLLPCNTHPCTAKVTSEVHVEGRVTACKDRMNGIFMILSNTSEERKASECLGYVTHGERGCEKCVTEKESMSMKEEREQSLTLELAIFNGWVAGEWSMCSASCGGGSRTRTIFCTEENGNETTKPHRRQGMEFHSVTRASSTFRQIRHVCGIYGYEVYSRGDVMVAVIKYAFGSGIRLLGRDIVAIKRPDDGKVGEGLLKRSQPVPVDTNRIRIFDLYRSSCLTTNAATRTNPVTRKLATPSRVPCGRPINGARTPRDATGKGVFIATQCDGRKTCRGLGRSGIYYRVKMSPLLENSV